MSEDSQNSRESQDTRDSQDEPPQDSTTGGVRPGDSMRELFHPHDNVGPTDAEQDQQQQAIAAAAAEADRIRAEPGHHGRQHL